MNQLVAIGILERFGLKANISSNGIEAIDELKLALEDKPYDLVLMDCKMPEMDGYEAARQIRLGNAGEENKEIIIVALTANAMQGNREKCLAADMTDFLSKPIEPELLLKN